MHYQKRIWKGTRGEFHFKTLLTDGCKLSANFSIFCELQIHSKFHKFPGRGSFFRPVLSGTSGSPAWPCCVFYMSSTSYICTPCSLMLWIPCQFLLIWYRPTTWMACLLLLAIYVTGMYFSGTTFLRLHSTVTLEYLTTEFQSMLQSTLAVRCHEKYTEVLIQLSTQYTCDAVTVPVYSQSLVVTLLQAYT